MSSIAPANNSDTRMLAAAALASAGRVEWVVEAIDTYDGASVGMILVASRDSEPKKPG